MNKVKTSRIKDPGEELRWLQRRKVGIGSSEAPVLYLGKVWKTVPVDVFLDKLEPAKINKDGNSNFRRGHVYEPLALALYAEHYGVEVYAPKTDEERFNDWQLFHPSLPVFTDLDASDSDGWIVEVKAPRQMMFDRYMSTGVPDYNQVQGHHHCGVVDAVGYLPGVGKVEPGKVKGVRFVVYAPETVEIFVWEMPYDSKMSADVLTKCSKWWERHVVAKVPPVDPALGKIVKIKNKGGKFQLVEGDAWEQAAQEFIYAREMHKAAKRRYDKSKALIKMTMETGNLEKVQLGSGAKFSNGLRNGKTSFDIKAFRAAHPGMNLEPWHKQGKPYRQLTPSGAMDSPFDADVEQQGGVMLAEQLRRFAGRQLDPELAASVFDELKRRMTAYTATIEAELDEIGDAFSDAEQAAAEKTKRTV